MDLYYGLSDQTASSASSDSSWIDDSIRRRRLSSASPSTFLAPAFSACAATQSTSPLDLDSSLIRFTRPRPRCDSPDSAASARGRLRKLLQLRSPLRSVENLPRTPVKLVGVGEDVLVMDGVLVSDAAEPTRNKPGSGESGSSGLASSSGSNSGKSSLYKTEMCRSWEDTGLCRYGSKCQFAHGKEELRGPRPIKPKSDMGRQCSKSAPKFRSNLRLGIAAPVPKRTTGSYALPHMGSTIRRAEEAPARTPSPPSEASTAFVWPPTEEEDAYFARVLYAPSARKRLPVFVEFCPE